MYQIIIVPANSSANTVLTFRYQDSFDAARKNLHERLKGGGLLIVQDDDAGQSVEIPADNVSYMMYLDVEKQQRFAEWTKATTRSPKAQEEMVA